MSVIALLIIFSLVVAVGFLLAFIWAVKTGQYEDRYTPSVRILFDDVSDVSDKLKEESSVSENDKIKKSK